MTPMAQSDELAMVRSRIAHLRAREAALCDALAAAGASGRLGRWTRARVTERRLRIFDHRLLPLAVQADPAFWCDRIKTEVEVQLRGEVSGAGLPRAMTGDDMAITRAMGAADANLVAHLARH